MRDAVREPDGNDYNPPHAQAREAEWNSDCHSYMSMHIGLSLSEKRP
jgi:hypothetical protein